MLEITLAMMSMAMAGEPVKLAAATAQTPTIFLINTFFIIWIPFSAWYAALTIRLRYFNKSESILGGKVR